MTPEWEMATAAELGMAMGMGAGMGAAACWPSPASNVFGHAPLDSRTSGVAPAYFCSMPPNVDAAAAAAAALRIDDVQDLSNAHQPFPSSGSAVANAAVDNYVFPAAAEPFSGGSRCFADDFYIPSEEAAELEWLSKFVDDSYSDIPYHPSSSAAAAHAMVPYGGAGPDSSPSAPGRGARSKRSRGGAGSGLSAAWHSLVPHPPHSSPSSSSSSSSDPPCSKPAKAAGCSRGKKSSNGSDGGTGAGGEVVGMEGGVRRCTHCASEKTPQWRTGPMGPKTLCNACGVRYKSGRLMPEYRPAASPTFVLTQHSNSHRKVIELRRQKEMLLLRGHGPGPSPASTAATGRPDLLFDDYGGC